MEELVKALPLPLYHGDMREATCTSAPEGGQIHDQDGSSGRACNSGAHLLR